MSKHQLAFDHAGQSADIAKDILASYREIEAMEKELRKHLGSSFEVQIDLCRALDLSPQYVNDILRNRRGFSHDTLKSITKLKRRV